MSKKIAELTPEEKLIEAVSMAISTGEPQKLPATYQGKQTGSNYIISSEGIMELCDWNEGRTKVVCSKTRVPEGIFNKARLRASKRGKITIKDRQVMLFGCVCPRKKGR